MTPLVEWHDHPLEWHDHSLEWHDYLIRVTWLLQMWGMTLFTWGLWHVCDMRFVSEWHDSLVRVTWLFQQHLFPMSLRSVRHAWHDLFRWVTWRVQLIDVTLLYIWNSKWIGIRMFIAIRLYTCLYSVSTTPMKLQVDRHTNVYMSISKSISIRMYYVYVMTYTDVYFLTCVKS